MSALESKDALRPGPTGLKKWVAARLTEVMPLGLRLFQLLGVTPRFGGMWIITRHDDVREVFASDGGFATPYGTKLSVITEEQPFFLAMSDGPEYHAGVTAMRRVMRDGDLPALARRTEALATLIVEESGGQLEVVDQLARRVMFDVIGEYLGVPPPPKGELCVWGTRLFEFQFADLKNDPALRAEVDEIAPAFRRLINDEIARRKSGQVATDDVLGRCLDLQRTGEPGFSDVEIRTALLCMVVGGPPQPAMVVPQALEQLLRRPDVLKAAQAAARAGDDALLRDYVFEAMRFDPLALGLPRVTTKACTIAKGTRQEKVIPAGSNILAGISAAMLDPRRVSEPHRFRPGRASSEYIHFGHGLHECFGRHINRATLHLLLKPLLKRPNLRRAPGTAGKLSKIGPLADRLVVRYD